MANTAMRLLHIAWALLCCVLCVFLALAGGGHPPPIVLVPVVVVGWVIGHLAMWSVSALVRRGRTGHPGSERWPPGIVIVLLGPATVTAVTIFQIATTVLIGNLYPFKGALWFVMAGVGTVHAIAIAGVLLRRNWGQVLAALACFSWSVLMITHVAIHLIRGQSVTASD